MFTFNYLPAYSLSLFLSPPLSLLQVNQKVDKAYHNAYLPKGGSSPSKRQLVC